MKLNIGLFTVTLAVLVLPAVADPAPAPPPFAAHLGAQSIDVSGATANGDVLIFGSSITRESFTPKFAHISGVVTASISGDVTFTPPRAIATSSIWVAVDMETGAWALAIPPGSPALAIPIPPNLLKRGGNAKVEQLQLPFEFSDAALIRPGKGAWKVVAVDNGRRDTDGRANGSVSVALESFTELRPDKKPPHELTKNDVLIVIEPQTLEYFIVTGKE